MKPALTVDNRTMDRHEDYLLSRIAVMLWRIKDLEVQLQAVVEAFIEAEHDLRKGVEGPEPSEKSSWLDIHRDDV